MSRYPKRLIEVDLPIARISAHARREKSIRHGHISTLHIWWARRPLAACRAVILASLWPDPEDLTAWLHEAEDEGETGPMGPERRAPRGCKPGEGVVIRPRRFLDEARRQMADWARVGMSKSSVESHSRLVAAAHDPATLHDPIRLRAVLLDFIADFADWDHSTDGAYLDTARALTQAAHEALGGEPGTRPMVVDPFAGGGSIPLEALRVGADAFASDLNPIPVLLNKVVLEYIPKYGQRLADEVRRWGAWIKEQAEKELAEFYPKDPAIPPKRGQKDDPGTPEATPIAYLWARTILSEAPGQGEIPVEVPLMRSLWLAKKTGRKRALRWVRDEKTGKVKTQTLDVTYVEDGQAVVKRVKRPLLEIFTPKKDSEVEGGTVARGSATCPVTDFTTKVDSVRAQLKKRRGGAADARLFAVVTTREGVQGRFYRLPTKADQAAFDAAAAELERREREDGTERSGVGRAAGHRSVAAGVGKAVNERSLVPDEIISLNELRRVSIPIYGMERWGDLFSPRQALSLTTLIRLVREAAARCAPELSTSAQASNSGLQQNCSSPASTAEADKVVGATRKKVKSGLAKRLIEVGEALFVKKDPESALLPLCAAIDRVAKDVYGTSGRSVYQRFVHERMELITRVAFNGTAILNMNFAINPIHDDKGQEIKPHVRDANGIALYSFQQILYHIVRCKLAHECEIPSVLRDSGRSSGQIRMDQGRLCLPYDVIALGLLVALLAEVDLKQELRGTIFDGVAWKDVPLSELSGESARALAIARGEEKGDSPQKMVHSTHLAGHSQEVESDFPGGLSDAVATCLAMAVGRQADAISSLCRWEGGGEFQAGTYGRQALGMVWDFSEVNPWAGAGGSFAGTIEWVAEVVEANAETAAHLGHSENASAAEHPLPSDSAEAIVTDPPYYDAVPYAYLSDYFFVWMRRTLADIHPALFREAGVPKDAEIVVDRPHQLSQSTKDIAFYERELTRAFAEGRRILRPDGIAAIVFASKTTASWEAILQAVIEAGWIITASWPIDTEREARVAAQGQARLGSSVHLVCRPRENVNGSVRSSDVGDWRDVLAELPRRIHEWMPRLAAEGVVGADAIFACLGPGLEVFSRYSRVEKASGEAVTLPEYLEHVWAVVSNEALTMIFKDADAAGLEPDARLTAMWLWTLGGGAGQANGNGKAAAGGNGKGSAGGKSKGSAGGKGKRVAADAGEEAEAEADDGDDEEAGGGKKGKVSGFALEFDAARKIAQGLGVHLEKCATFVEVKGDTARLLPVAERTPHLFGRPQVAVPAAKGRRKKAEATLFQSEEQIQSEIDTAEAESAGALAAGKPGATVLDRVHQSMLLFAAGRSEALRRFLVEDGIGKDARFWKLADSLSKLYPARTDEKRWVDGVLGRKKGLGL